MCEGGGMLDARVGGYVLEGDFLEWFFEEEEGPVRDERCEGYGEAVFLGDGFDDGLRGDVTAVAWTLK